MAIIEELMYSTAKIVINNNVGIDFVINVYISPTTFCGQRLNVRCFTTWADCITLDKFLKLSNKTCPVNLCIKLGSI